jgi:hypothetical protein
MSQEFSPGPDVLAAVGSMLGFAVMLLGHGVRTRPDLVLLLAGGGGLLLLVVLPVVPARPVSAPGLVAAAAVAVVLLLRLASALRPGRRQVLLAAFRRLARRSPVLAVARPDLLANRLLSLREPGLDPAALDVADRMFESIVRRVAFIAGLPSEEADAIALVAPLRDIGRLGSGGAEDAHQHPLLGFRMLSRTGIPTLDLAAELVLHHHERWDGAGYPFRIGGADIPMRSRVLSLCELLASLAAAARPGGDGLNGVELEAALRAEAGRSVDPTLLERMLPRLPEVLAGCRVAACTAWHSPVSILRARLEDEAARVTRALRHGGSLDRIGAGGAGAGAA